MGFMKTIWLKLSTFLYIQRNDWDAHWFVCIVTSKAFPDVILYGINTRTHTMKKRKSPSPDSCSLLSSKGKLLSLGRRQRDPHAGGDFALPGKSKLLFFPTGRQLFYSSWFFRLSVFEGPNEQLKLLSVPVTVFLLNTQLILMFIFNQCNPHERLLQLKSQRKLENKILIKKPNLKSSDFMMS